MSVYKKIVFFIVFVLSSCSKTTIEPQPPIPIWKEYLIYAEDKNIQIERIEFQSDTSRIVFDDKSVLAIPESELKLISYAESGLPSVELVGDVWCIGGKDTGIVARRNLSKLNSEIVFAGFDDQSLLLAFVSGDILTLGIVQPKPKHIPRILIVTDGKKPVTSKEEYVTGNITIEDSSQLYSRVMLYEGKMRIRGRGNSTWGLPKKPYKIKLDEKAALLGYPKDKEWCLLADYYDRSLLRNELAMELSRILGFSWTPRTAKVEVWLNGNYEGVYTFCEHKKVSKNRVNIADTDVYLTIDEVQDQTVHFKTSMNIPVGFEEPEVPAQSQIKYIEDYLNSFEASLQGQDFKDPTADYAQWIDIPSFVNYYILQELLKNIDGNVRRSTFLTKQEDRKLEMYHVWDFDLAIGNCNYFGREFPGASDDYSGFYIRDYNQYGKKYTGWYYFLFKDPEFVDAVKERWNEVKPQLETIPSYIDRMVSMMGDAPERNFTRWNILDKTLTCPGRGLYTYRDHVRYLKEFYIQRLNWLDKELNK